ncbi:activating signal cointegrator 1-like [Mytilus galloprovincialis]|uniref:activating signal cointegrator 1-like n=1 Tax=Mytilus galloprovincialis TaxID=29158 RepID=UPI003F7BA522
MATKIEDWMCEELEKLGIPASHENAHYILSIGSAEDLEEYMLELLDGSDPRVHKFIHELLIKWDPPENGPEIIQVYRKPALGDEDGNSKKKTEKSNKHTDNQKKGLLNGATKSKSDSFPSAQLPSNDFKKKSKFVPLFSQEGQEKTVVKLQGRHACECQAAKHKLISNCTRCGRVVCEQEGSGPCLFCGHLVCTVEEQEVLSRGSKKSEQLRHRLMKDADRVQYVRDKKDFLPSSNSKINDGYQKALQHKDKLLDYDKTSARRTQVIDDESDYFATDSNRWLSNKEREKLRKREEELRSQRFASRKDRKITLDFAGRQVLEENNTVDMYNVNDEVVQEIQYGAKHKKQEFVHKEEDFDSITGIVNPNIKQHAPQFVDNKVSGKNSPANVVGPEKKKPVRIQDRELLQMSDDGHCLSMHQPWALLLVKGIKIHEGRSWYTPIRGRLWIAATAKSPSPQETVDVEQQYRYLLNDQKISFPTHYPVACLLGCVDLVDCLPQDEYRKKFPDGESISPYVFICENPQELVVKFPIKGKHKIYKLEGHIHQAAKKGLRSSSD